MKKNIFMVSVAMLALVSCTKDEVIQINNGQKIDFRTAMETRASVLEEGGLGSFYVTALNESGQTYFSDILFSKVENSIYFTSEDNYYWPDGELKFYAYYPSEEDLGGTVNITGESQTLTGYTPAEDIADQLDFITAQASGDKKDESVALNFNHQLSQVEINAFSKNEGYKIYVKAIRIKNAIKTGSFDFHSVEWSILEEDNISDGDLTDYEIQITTPQELSNQSVSLMGGKGSAMLIPQSRPAWEVQADETEQTPTPDPDPEVPEDPAQTVEVDETPTDGNNDEEIEVEEIETPSTPEAAPGTYIAFLIQVNTAAGVRVFPTTEGVDYAWVAKPMAFDWAPGYKYTYNCDFTDGLGVIAPDNFEDPDNPIFPGDDDDPQPGEEVVYGGGEISVSVNFSSWNTNYSNDDEIYDSSHTVPMD